MYVHLPSLSYLCVLEILTTMKKKHSDSKPRLRQSNARNAGKPKGVARKAADAIGMRLNKYVAHSGICSRRQAGDYVKDGLVTVNGKIEINPAYQIQKGDEVSFRGKPIKPEARLIYLLLNKPKNVITTTQDDRGRKTVMDLIGEAVPERVFPVGRLDRDTTGLLLLTNDGDLAKKLMHPSHKVPKVYKATLDKTLSKQNMGKIAEGLTLEDGPVSVNWINFPNDKLKKEVSLEIHHGRNRIVRRIFEHLGYNVDKLDRSYLAGLNKKDLPRGFFRYLTEKEILMLKHFTK